MKQFFKNHLHKLLANSVKVHGNDTKWQCVELDTPVFFFTFCIEDAKTNHKKGQILFNVFKSTQIFALKFNTDPRASPAKKVAQPCSKLLNWLWAMTAR